MPPARVRALGLGLTATVMMIFALAGSSRISGPVILTLVPERHGVHLDDLIVVACWAASMGWCWLLWREKP